MKRLIILILVLAMALSTAACGCNHENVDSKLIAVDTAALTAQWEQTCANCGEVLETTETSTGIAPANGVMALSPEDWFACLSTNIANYNMNMTLMPVEAEAQENTLLFSVLNPSGIRSAIVFHDKDGAVFTTERRNEAGAVNSIHVQAQFTNDTATQFYLLLSMLAITNNSALTPEEAGGIASQIMNNLEVSDNGYHYQLSITSVEDHTVQLTITAE